MIFLHQRPHYLWRFSQVLKGNCRHHASGAWKGEFNNSIANLEEPVSPLLLNEICFKFVCIYYQVWAEAAFIDNSSLCYLLQSV